MRVIARRRTSKYRVAWQKRRGGDDPRLIAILGEDDADPDGEGVGHHVQGEVPANNHSFERFEIDDALRWAITQLQPKYRAVAELTFLDSSVSPRFLQHRRDSGEVAELLGIAEGTVRNRLSTARSMLADLLRED